MSSLIMSGFETYVRTELGLSQETLSAYTRDVEEFLEFVGDQKLTAQLTETFVNHLRHNGRKPTTVRRKCMSIRCFYHHLISLGLLDPNILNMIDPIRINRRIPDALEPQAVDVLIAAVEKRVPICRATNFRRDVAVILTMYHSGLRVSELCGLNLPDVNLSKRTLRVRGKGGRERMVPTTPECAESIQVYIDNERKSETEALFVKANGQRITRRAISDMLMSLSRRAGVSHTTPHVLRRSCATSLMNRGVDLELVQELLGHQHLSTTQTYLAISYDRLVEVYKCCHPRGK